MQCSLFKKISKIPHTHVQSKQVTHKKQSTQYQLPGNQKLSAQEFQLSFQNSKFSYPKPPQFSVASRTRTENYISGVTNTNSTSTLQGPCDLIPFGGRTLCRFTRRGFTYTSGTSRWFSYCARGYFASSTS